MKCERLLKTTKVLLNVGVIKINNMRFLIILFLLSGNLTIFGQQILGTVFDMNNDVPVKYVSIGIVGKNIGTVSDHNGKYTLKIEPEYHNDTLRFSSIGYYSYSVKVSDFINLNNGNVSLENRTYELTELVVRPNRFKKRTLGIVTRDQSSSSLCIYSGWEFGIPIRNNNAVFIREVNINVHLNASTYKHDSIFFRINIYKIQETMLFENILSSPILSKQNFKSNMTIDLRQHHIFVEGSFLVTFEILELSGHLCFPTGNTTIRHKTYVRRASQGTWEIMNEGASISVLVDIER